MAPKITAIPLPEGSLLHRRNAPGDFLDCFAVTSDRSAREAATIIVQWPLWARVMLKMRWIMTAPFGLLQEGPPSADAIGPFPVETETDSEIVAGFDDKHLDFRISVMSTEGRVTLATWVHRHHIGGHIYLRMILPFHTMIARNALARVARA